MQSLFEVVVAPVSIGVVPAPMERVLLRARNGRRGCQADVLLLFIWSSLEDEHVQQLLLEGHAEGAPDALGALLPLVSTELEGLCRVEI
eukprot:12944277-Alexandrium_andersonii.AAC.1